MDNETYYIYYQIPIFVVLLSIVWGFIGIRLIVFLRNNVGWKSYRGVSTALILVAGGLCTVYTALLVTNYFMNEGIKRIRETFKPGEPNPGGFPDRDPMFFSDEEVEVIIMLVKKLIKLIYWSRFVLVLGLWTIKIAFLSIFLETREALSRRSQYFLYTTSAIIAITFILSIWNIVKDMTDGIWSLVPSARFIRRGAMYSGARFIYHDADVELTINAANIITDIMLVIIAWKTVRSFNLPLRRVILPCVMIGVTVSLALGRLVLIIITRQVPSYSNYGVVQFELFAELETFIAAMVACLPGIRAFFRNRANAREAMEKGAVPGTSRELLTRISVDDEDPELGAAEKGLVKELGFARPPPARDTRRETTDSRCVHSKRETSEGWGRDAGDPMRETQGFVFVKHGEVINVPPLQTEDARRGMVERKTDVL